jgi:hypothetical protein
MPGLEEEVMVLAPATLAPYTILMAASSLSAWIKEHPFLRLKWVAIYSVNSF